MEKRPPNYHAILIQYVGPTATNGSRTRLTSQRFEKDSVSDGYDSETGNSLDQGVEMLRTLGYNVIGMAEAKNGTIVFTDTFKKLKEQATIFKAKKRHSHHAFTHTTLLALHRDGL
jgi:hypothetical protein